MPDVETDKTHRMKQAAAYAGAALVFVSAALILLVFMAPATRFERISVTAVVTAGLFVLLSYVTVLCSRRGYDGEGRGRPFPNVLIFGTASIMLILIHL